MTQVIEALKWRYATKKFDAQRKLSTAQITLLKNAFNLTATSFGLQPVRLIVLKDQKIKEQLVAASMNQQQVADASHVLILCIEKKVNGAYIEQYFKNVKDIRNTPDDILQPFKTYLLDHFSNKTPEENNLWATKQAYIVLGNLLTVCAIEEIDACPMEGFTPAMYDEILKLEEKGLQSVLIMPVGYRAKDDMFVDLQKVRKTLDDAVIEI